ncbi:MULTISPECIES: hypothetical protein [unclassified Providencia]|uniref:hypothetical protein n=1 Tax=unclassified Providencia TaxID=2633465 RepID=UPI0013E01D3A|nr:hypothetical protein FVA69_09925 [Providencia sp. 1701011]QIF61797.1 hypothetical protein FVA70_09935 [Providencia sp. 1701091]
MTILINLAVLAGFFSRHKHKQFVYLKVIEMMFFIENGFHVFIVRGNKKVFSSFKEGIVWAFTTCVAIQTDKELSNEQSRTRAI